VSLRPTTWALTEVVGAKVDQDETAEADTFNGQSKGYQGTLF
jgi:hypothetical protein